MPLQPNKSTTANPRSTKSKTKSPMRGLMAMMLLLTLCAGGCLHSPNKLLPSMHQGPLGNAVLMTLPPGTQIIPPAGVDPAPFGAFVNEIGPAKVGTPNLLLRAPLKLATPAYIAERDAAESALFKQIQDLKVQLRPK